MSSLYFLWEKNTHTKTNFQLNAHIHLPRKNQTKSEMPSHVYYFIFFTSSSLSLPFSFPCFFLKEKWEKKPHKTSTLKFLVLQVILMSCWLYIIIIIYVLSTRSTKNNILYKKVGIFSTGLKESKKTSFKALTMRIISLRYYAHSWTFY